MKQITAVLLYSLVILGPTNAFGQKRFLSIGPELALPGTYEQSYNNRGTGFGGSFRIESVWSKHFSGTVSMGYLSFAKATPFPGTQAYSTQVNVIPIQVGMKYYGQERNNMPKGLFISGELGIMPTITHITYTDGSAQKHNEFCFSSAIGLGYLFKNIELSFRLQQNLTITGFHVYYYNFRIAYAFLKSKALRS